MLMQFPFAVAIRKVKRLELRDAASTCPSTSMLIPRMLKGYKLRQGKERVVISTK
jgi:hypothetical protein